MPRQCSSRSPIIWEPPCHVVPAGPGDRGAGRRRGRASANALACQTRKAKAAFQDHRGLGERAGQGQHLPAALKHFELAIQLDSSEQSLFQSALSSIKSNAAVAPWLKDSYSLEDVPGGLEGPARAEFEQALDWARDGLWDSAAAAFELLSADRAAGHAADYNLGLCRLWLGDHQAAIGALRRWIAREGPITRAVDLEVVCQLIDESTDKEPIEHVQLTWPLRDRAALINVLESDATIVAGEKRHLNPEDDEFARC